MERNEENEVDRMIVERFSSFRPSNDWNPDTQRGLSLLRDRRAAKGRKRNWWIAAAGSLALSVPLVAFPVTRALAARCVSACVQETAVVRQLLLGNLRGSTPSSAFVSSDNRKMAPDFTLSDASGKPVTLSEFRGKVVLLNFWATWCSPCQKEIPWFVEFQRANESRGFTVLGVSMDETGWSAVRPFMAQKGVNYPMVIGNDEVSGLFGGLQTIPLSIIIDRSGRIAAIHSGLCNKDEYESDLAAILGEK
jgi:cytochrome c biogenesis protein CcmG/thiol:disulfide interchange protein DsbE